MLPDYGFDMSPEEFRKSAHEVVDWIADYLRDVREYPVLPKTQPGELRAALPSHGPEHGEPMERILADFRHLIVPATTHWNHPRFHGYFSISSSGPGILGEMLMAGLNVQGMLWKTSPAKTELEQVVLDWFRQWLGLPEPLFGIIYDTASISSMHALAAARERCAPEMRTEGMAAGLTLYCSEQAHSSIEKAALTIGVGQNQVRKIPVDAQFRMRVDLLERAIEEDWKTGRRPFCVVSAIGTTATSACDPTSDIADLARRYELWLHVDAAYAGPAALAEEFRPLFTGWERADSIVINPHKWMATPQDVSVFFTRHPEILKRAFALAPEYLKTAQDGQVVNFNDYGLQLGRRFRALKLWFVMRYFGRQRLAEMIREHCRLARLFASWVEADPRLALAAPVPFSLVCFRHRAGDEATHALMDRVNASGVALLSPGVLQGHAVARMAVGNIKATESDLRATWDAVQAALA